ncbi:MAG: hypothetical protein ACLRI8_09525 [Agathobacter rectalis]
MISCRDVNNLQMDGMELVAEQQGLTGLCHGRIWCRQSLIRII